MAPAFGATLAAALPAPAAAAADDDASCVVLGVHLCGPLSPRAIDLFAASARLGALVLVPCCLDRRTDGALKLQAKSLGLDPYELKVRQLAGLLEGTPAEVTVVRSAEMRTTDGTEGGAMCKNAIIVGRKRPPSYYVVQL